MFFIFISQNFIPPDFETIYCKFNKAKSKDSNKVTAQTDEKNRIPSQMNVTLRFDAIRSFIGILSSRQALENITAFEKNKIQSAAFAAKIKT